MHLFLFPLKHDITGARALTENERRIIAVKVLMTAVDLALDILQDEALNPKIPVFIQRMRGLI